MCLLLTIVTKYCFVWQMSEKISQYARYLFEEVDNNWSVVYEDGEMKVYRREMEDGGVVVDPLKSFYTATVSYSLS
jgi:argonaute-like protein implicated in RNA metabolism and viral defense